MIRKTLYTVNKNIKHFAKVPKWNSDILYDIEFGDDI